VRLLYVIQRFGADVPGGAEAHCREFAQRMAGRGHVVEVLTTTARSHITWEPSFAVGDADDGGVLVHRLPIGRPKDRRRFEPLNVRALRGPKPVPWRLQRTWAQLQGPDVPDLVPWLAAEAGRFDVVVFFQYLYSPTTEGLPVASARVPTLLHATAHDEPPMALALFDTVFRHPWAFAFSTPEEQALVERRFGVHPPSGVIGVGVDLDASGDVAAFRRRFGLGERPYVVNVGRFEAGKGSDQLLDFHETYRRRRPGAPALVVVGERFRDVAPHGDLVLTGVVDEATRSAALAGALALVQPSFFESFSMVLTEAWAQRRPALVQGRSDVLVGQARRSGGGLPYVTYAEFEVALDRFRADAALADRLGRAGRRYAEANYAWPVVMDRYEALLERTAALGSHP
jgi:glycosyltransferase involved in cell wall biosynthesis